MEENQMCETPLEDLRNSALAEYELASTAIHSWNSFIVNAIRNYEPKSNRLENPPMPKIAEECKWEVFSNDIILADCQNGNTMVLGTLAISTYKYCPYCGKQIKNNTQLNKGE